MKQHRLKKINPRIWEVYKKDFFVGIITKEIMDNNPCWIIDGSGKPYKNKTLAAEELLRRL